MQELDQRFSFLCRKLFELSSDGFLLVDANGKILYINEAYCRQLKTTQKDAIGRPVEEIVLNTDLPNMIKNRQLHPEKDISWRVKPHQYSSNDKYAFISRQVIEDDHGLIIGAVGQVRFIRQTMNISLEMQRLNKELDYLKSELRSHGKYTFDSIIGDSPELTEVKNIARKISASDIPVLITGESGTGKELFANAIHEFSPRRKGPFVSVNCSAIPSELFESELFGYVEGAFTGARKGGKQGKILLANNGTLFLDEIGDMPYNMQAKLLRVLQEHELEMIGAEAPRKIDIRIIAATNKNLLEEIDAGNFRLDLFYRLNVIQLKVPPLRERRGDIMKLAQYFLDELNTKYSTNKSFSKEVYSLLKSYDYPGNIRELRNLIERAYILSSDKKITTSHFPIHESPAIETLALTEGASLSDLLIDFKYSVVQETLKKCDGNVSQCADLLGIHRSSLYNIVAAYKKKHA